MFASQASSRKINLVFPIQCDDREKLEVESYRAEFLTGYSCIDPADSAQVKLLI